MRQTRSFSKTLHKSEVEHLKNSLEANIILHLRQKKDGKQTCIEILIHEKISFSNPTCCFLNKAWEI